MSRPILFTAFEPSGDAHAAPVIEELCRREPDRAVVAWGGPRMRAAGAEVIEETTGDAAMGLDALGRIARVRRQAAAIRAWAATSRPAVHVPVDSPAANFPVCRDLRAGGARVVHLVAPQIWAWGPWRIRKLRRRTDLVLCLLPFEEAWFRDRGVPARFIGHPRIDRPLDEAALARRAGDFPAGTPRIVLLPGSRPHEAERNLVLLGEVFARLRAEQGGAAGLVAAASPEIAAIIRRHEPRLPGGLPVVVGEADAAIAWADLCLAVSGTVTLDCARLGTPMVGVYRTTRLAALVARVLLRTPWRLLPNLVAGREIVPEFVPWAGGAGPIAAAAAGLLREPGATAQRAALAAVRDAFVGHRPDVEAASAILEIASASDSAPRPVTG